MKRVLFSIFASLAILVFCAACESEDPQELDLNISCRPNQEQSHQLFAEASGKIHLTKKPVPAGAASNLEYLEYDADGVLDIQLKSGDLTQELERKRKNLPAADTESAPAPWPEPELMQERPTEKLDGGYVSDTPDEIVWSSDSLHIKGSFVKTEAYLSKGINTLYMGTIHSQLTNDAQSLKINIDGGIFAPSLWISEDVVREIVSKDISPTLPEDWRDSTFRAECTVYKGEKAEHEPYKQREGKPLLDD